MRVEAQESFAKAFDEGAQVHEALENRIELDKKQPGSVEAKRQWVVSGYLQLSSTAHPWMSQ